MSRVDEMEFLPGERIRGARILLQLKDGRILVATPNGLAVYRAEAVERPMQEEGSERSGQLGYPLPANKKPRQNRRRLRGLSEFACPRAA